MRKPLLSIGMIVKNEIRCIETCLRALQPLREAIPCELVIADTGSTDGTREIAEQYADLLFDFAWVDDFSAARNAVLDRCAGKWYLAVDADEYLDPDFTQLTGFLTGPEADQYFMAMVNQYSYNNLEMKGPGADFLAGRMARLDLHPRYSGAIHETLPAVPADKKKILMDVKLHHDGYAKDPRRPERQIQKMERNLALLERELAKNPQSLRRLLQCVESAGPFPARKADYVRRAMKALARQRGSREGEAYGAVLCRHALQTAAAQKMPELEKWRRWAGANFPDSMFLRLDGNFFLLKYYFEQAQYEEVPGLTEAFLAAWRDCRDRNFDLMILSTSILNCSARKFEVYARTLGGKALARLGRTGEAAALLAGEPDWEGLEPAELHTLLEGCAWAAGEPEMQDFAAAGAAAVRSLPGREGGPLWERFLTAAEAAFRPQPPEEEGPERPWRLYARVEGALGRAVRLMEGALPEVRAVLSQIPAEDWPDVPAPAAVRAAELGAELPEGFFAQSRERLQAAAVQLSETLSPAAVLDWEGRWDFTGSMARFQFLMDLLTAACQAEKTWEGEEAWRGPLCRRFLAVAADYLPNYYNPELLSDAGDWAALPGIHRFALHLLRGQEALEEEDAAGYLRALRRGLRQAPRMKRMVKFLMDEAGGGASAVSEDLGASMELTALAAQVRAILARFAPGDPAVDALKQSPAYRQVAHLLEPEEEARAAVHLHA